MPRSLRNALRAPAKTIARGSAKIRYCLGGVETLEIRPGWRVRCHPLSRLLFEVFVTDPEQRAELDDFVANCEPGMRLLDVGAHWGFFSLAALHFGGPKARALAVEASPDAAKILAINLRMNGVTDRVALVQAAAGSGAGTLQMLTTGAGGADYFVVPSEGRSDTITVPQVALSDLCAERQFWPTHVKVDVEGFEEEVLCGVDSLVQKRRPIIFLELHGDLIRRRHKDPRAVLEQLSAWQYRCFQRGMEMTEANLNAIGFNARMACRPL